ncbi:MAG: Asd/ArgC dimerization domain-containing protein [Gammaproteobacteria bacterium]
MKGVDLVVVGGDSYEAEALMSALAESDLPLREIHVLGAREDEAARVDFGGRLLKPKPIKGFDFTQVGLALFVGDAPADACTPSDALKAGAMVLDLSGGRWGSRESRTVMPGRIPRPDERAVAMALPTPGLAQVYTVTRPFLADAEGTVNGFLVEPVSRLGKPGIEQLARQTARVLNMQPVENSLMPAQIAFNTLPIPGAAADARDQKGWRELVGESGGGVSLDRVMAPVFFGTTACVRLRISPSVETGNAYAADPRVELMDDSQPPPSPVGDAAGQDRVYVHLERVERAGFSELTIWSVADNLHWAIAANTVDVLSEILI